MLDFSNACLIRNAEQEKAWRDTCLQLSQEQFQPWIHTFRPIAGLEPHRQAATQWLKEKTGLDVETKSLLITNGCAEAIDLALSSLAGPNDLVLCERLTDHGVIGMSQVLGFKLKGLEIDEHGIIPDHFEELCDDQKVTALVCTPNLNNPPERLCRSTAGGKLLKLPHVTMFISLKTMSTARY
ncbi:transcriptional regulator [Klebsiella michiganensis]|uniref:Transcriptional regulator n=1 Tax=Klebsiella michiganensis TaxID=1134687 RepID=A0A7H4MSV4_9ENTR|nr:transcriptional regulator [Klebsiella michiganensis]